MIDLEKRAKAWDEFSGESMEWTVSNTFNAAYGLGFRDGDASIDRVEIVRAAFEEVNRELDTMPDDTYSLQGAMDAVIAAMEKGK